MIHNRTIGALAWMFVAGYATATIPMLPGLMLGTLFIGLAVITLPHAETVADDLADVEVESGGGQI